MILQKEFQNPYDTENSKQKIKPQMHLYTRGFILVYRPTVLSAAFWAAARTWAAFWCTFLWALFT
jgi:hypothetical protein